MRSKQTNPTGNPLVLKAEKAADLMAPNPVSIRDQATVAEAIALLTDRGFSAAPVVDKAGRAVGVISRTDLLVHDRERLTHLCPVPEQEDTEARKAAWQSPLPWGFTVEEVDSTQVADMMTPVVFSVLPDTSAEQVIEDMLGLHVHHLFVVDAEQVLVGVISALDIVRHLRPMFVEE